MYRISGANLHRWVIPIGSTILLFIVLLFFVSYNSGDSSLKNPLGLVLWQTWTTSSPDAQDYTYCLLVPIMLAYLIFESRARIARTRIRAENSSLIWIVLGIFLFWVGSRAGKQYLGCAGIQILLLGIIFWFWGRGVFRHLLFGWAVICFAWPLPFLDSAVAFPLRMIVSRLAYYTLNLAGIACVQNGTALLSAPDPHLGLTLGSRFQIDVADPCSGLHSLLPLLMFSAFYSYFFVRGRWQQWAVFLSAIPFTVVGNVVRISVLVFGCILWGSPFAVGTNEQPSAFHEACGFAVFGIVLGLECLFGILLIRASNRRPSASTSSPRIGSSLSSRVETQDTASSVDDSRSEGRMSDWRSFVLLGLTLAVFIVYLLSPPVYLPSQAGVVMDLPDRVKLPGMEGGDFTGLNAPVSEVEHRILPKDTEFARKNYDDFNDHQIFFSIVLSGVQQYTIHPPEVCLVAQGWSIIRQEDVPIQLLSGHQLVVRNLTIQREASDEFDKPHLVKAFYMYWYVADGITTASHFTRNWVSSWDRVVHNRDHRWAYVIAMAAITNTIRPDGLDSQQTRVLLTNFIREIVPTFQRDELVADPGSSLTIGNK